MTDNVKPVALEYFKPPFKYEPIGQTIYCVGHDNHSSMALQVRGWGNLIGGGANQLSVEKAEHVQDEFGQWVADTLNASVNRDRRILELLEANNRYLYRARCAEASNKELCRQYEDMVAECEWQPIETAPRDGTYILIKQENVLEPSQCVACFDDNWSNDGWWLCCDGKNPEIPLRGPAPTWWKPL